MSLTMHDSSCQMRFFKMIKLMSLIVALIYPVFARAHTAVENSYGNNCYNFLYQLNRPTPKAPTAKALPELYHVMPRLFKGGLNALTRQLPVLNQMGVGNMAMTRSYANDI